VQQSGISMSRCLDLRQSLREALPQPLPRAPSNIYTPPVVEHVTPAPVLRVEADIPFGVAAQCQYPDS